MVASIINTQACAQKYNYFLTLSYLLKKNHSHHITFALLIINTKTEGDTPWLSSRMGLKICTIYPDEGRLYSSTISSGVRWYNGTIMFALSVAFLVEERETSYHVFVTQQYIEEHDEHVFACQPKMSLNPMSVKGLINVERLCLIILPPFFSITSLFCKGSANRAKSQTNMFVFIPSPQASPVGGEII